MGVSQTQDLRATTKKESPHRGLSQASSRKSRFISGGCSFDLTWAKQSKADQVEGPNFIFEARIEVQLKFARESCLR